MSTSSSPASARYRRPAALMRGARRKPIARASSAPGSTLATRSSARIPGLRDVASACRPSRTRRRFSSRSGTQSATVASATRSRSSSAPAGSRAGAGQQRGRELVGDAGRAQVGARVAADGGVHDRRVGQRPVGARAVVVGDDDVHAGGARLRDLVDRGDRAVGGEQQARAALGQALDRRRAQPVAVLGAAGQVPVHVGAERRAARARGWRSSTRRRRRSRRGP